MEKRKPHKLYDFLPVGGRGDTCGVFAHVRGGGRGDLEQYCCSSTITIRSIKNTTREEEEEEVLPCCFCLVVFFRRFDGFVLYQFFYQSLAGWSNSSMFFQHNFRVASALFFRCCTKAEDLTRERERENQARRMYLQSHWQSVDITAHAQYFPLKLP